MTLGALRLVAVTKRSNVCLRPPPRTIRVLVPTPADAKKPFLSLSVVFFTHDDACRHLG